MLPCMARLVALEEMASCCANHPLYVQTVTDFKSLVKRTSGCPPFPNESGSELSGIQASHAPSGATEKRFGGHGEAGISRSPASPPVTVSAPGTNQLLGSRRKRAPTITKLPLLANRA
jgi:hypothetical protein